MIGSSVPDKARRLEPVIDFGHLGAIVDAVGDGVTVQAADGRLVYANLAAARASGFATARALVDAPSDEVFGQVELCDAERHPIDRRDLPGWTVFSGGTRASRIVGFRDRGTGGERWSAITAAPLYGRDGGIEYAVNVFHDITDQEEARRDAEAAAATADRLLDERDRERSRLSAILAERIADEARLADLVRSERARVAELHAVIGAIGEGLIVVDPAGTVTLANQTAQRMLGTDEHLTLAAVLERVALPDGLDLPALLKRGPVQARLSGPDRQWLELAAYAVDQPTEAGTGETILLLRDVTEAHGREQARDAFIGVLSHELRTPVTTIYAGTKVLARSETHLDEEARAGIFEDIHAEAERLHRLVEDVVALTRFQEGSVEVGNEPVLLQRVLPAVARSEQGRWPAGTFELDLPLDLPPVAADTTYVEQVVRNLLVNAMKYGGDEPTARVEAREADSGAEVEVRVLDAGPGFPGAEAHRLFELYYRSPNAARRVSGSGIGLFVCARLIDAMGGRIWAANRPAGGSEFGFSLRVMPADR